MGPVGDAQLQPPANETAPEAGTLPEKFTVPYTGKAPVTAADPPNGKSPPIDKSVMNFSYAILDRNWALEAYWPFWMSSTFG